MDNPDDTIHTVHTFWALGNTIVLAIIGWFMKDKFDKIEKDIDSKAEKDTMEQYIRSTKATLDSLDANIKMILDKMIPGHRHKER